MWNPDEQRAIATALLGSWPETTVRWGQDAFAAYVNELQERGVDAADVLRAIRTWPGDTDFAPSAPRLAAAARRDPDRPTWPEAFQLIYGPRGIFNVRAKPGRYDNEAQMIGARLKAARERAYDLDPLVGAFVDSYGIERLWAAPIHDDEHGDIRRRELQQAFDQFTEIHAERDRASLVAARSSSPGVTGPRRLGLALQAMERPSSDRAQPEG